MFNNLFFDSERYDLSSVGRVKMNMRLETPDVSDEIRVLRQEDVLNVLKTLVGLRDGRGEIDDIDNLGNRRVRSVGELLENQYRVGLLRMERAIKERMSSVDVDTVMPHDLINAKPAAAAVREFFGSSQLSQFMDQTNPLSRSRTSGACRPRAGGLTRERAGFEVRDVHPTHYGRSARSRPGRPEHRPDQLARHPRAGEQVRLHRKPVPPRERGQGRRRGQSTCRRWRRRSTSSARPTSSSAPTASLMDELCQVRINGEVTSLPRAVDFMDVSPKQVVSVARALIPFLENDDANRALMGSNMQRQAVPLVQAGRAAVGTGMEDVVARDSGATVSPAARAWSSRSTAPASSCAPPEELDAAPRASTSTACRSSSAPTRTPASTSVRWCAWATR
jgi:DNA-directed RNA polymerase subunit beta